MGSDSSSSDAPLITKIDLYETDERYEFKLSDILRKRHRPLLMLIDEDCKLLFASLPNDAPAVEHRLLGQALAETKTLFNSDDMVPDVVRQLIVEKPGEKCALVMLEDEFYSLRLFALHAPDEGAQARVYAALAEPIVKPLAEGVDFNRVKEMYRLTNREVDVLRALISGDTDKEIARSVGVSVETVRAYLKSVRAKLGVTTRTAIVHLVYQLSNEGASASQ